MFDFLRKSHTVKFLYSACLLCSLGSFISVYGNNVPAVSSISKFSVQTELGYEANKIFLDNPHVDNTGKLTGTLKYAITTPPGNEGISLANPYEDSKISIFLKDKNETYIAASNPVSPKKNYHIYTQLYKVKDLKSFPAGIIPTPSGEPIKALKPGTYAISGVVSDKGDHSMINGPVVDLQ